MLHRIYPLFTSKNLSGFAIDTFRKGPHISRVTCEDCGAVFANPMADSAELTAYYYEKDHYEAVSYKELIFGHFDRITTLEKSHIAQEARYLKNLKSGGKFLNVGCGLGLGLAYAKQFGCELYATEYDAGALEFVEKHFSVKTHQGDLHSTSYPEAFFDFVHISHVIEHVIDPRAYIQEMKRILKLGGILAIGTPNISSKLYTWHRWANLLRLRIPDVIDGLEHTFIFPKKRLRSFCEEEGLAVVDHYTHNLGEKIQPPDMVSIADV